MANLVAGTHKFFDFIDLKPGDFGEDTISIHVGSNDAWMCAAARITADLDNDITEPEDEATTAGGDNLDGTTDGDLDSEVFFAFWIDDGDNVYEPGQGTGGSPETIFLEGPLSGLGQSGQIALAQPILSGPSALGGTPIPGDSTFYIGKAWCFGDMDSSNLTQDGLNTVKPTDIRGTGFTCNGALVGNLAQTDSVQGDMQFYAVQARNNPGFLCSRDYTPFAP